MVGNRNDVYIENAGIALASIPYFVQFLWENRKDNNRLGGRLLRQCGSEEILMELHTRTTLWMFHLQPWSRGQNR